MSIEVGQPTGMQPTGYQPGEEGGEAIPLPVTSSLTVTIPVYTVTLRLPNKVVVTRTPGK